MICKWCNREVQDNIQFCSYCGGSLTNDANSLNIDNTVGVSEEKVNVGLAIVSFLIPLVGFIMFFVKKSEKPKTAKACGLCALISFILSLVVTIGSFFLIYFSFTSQLKENISNSWDENQIYDDYNNTIYDEFDEEDDFGADDENEDFSDVKTDANWKEYEVLINNTAFTLPGDYRNLTNLTGFSVKTSDLNSTLSGGYYTLLNMYYNNKLALNIEISNDTDSDLLYTDCKITRITQTKYQVSNGAVAIVFPGGLKAGDKITEDEIIELFGVPSDTSEYSNTGYESKTYKYYEDSTFTTTNNYEIKVVNGVIDEIKLDKRY